MKSTIMAAVSGFATAVSALGQARVVNKCADPVYLSNVPCTGSIDGPHILQSGDDYSQTFTELEGGCGWSIKMATSQEILDSSSNILQYEYAYQGGSDPIWYDMSLVNGKAPFPSYALESSDNSTCSPDSSIVFMDPTWPGMQVQCPNDVSITLNLCSGSSSEASGSSASSAAPASSSAAPVSSAAPAPAPTTYTTLQTKAKSSGGWTVELENVEASTEAAVTPTAIVTTASDAGGAVVVETAVQYVTQVSTVIVTARDAAPSEPPHKRHVHGHSHGGRA